MNRYDDDRGLPQPRLDVSGTTFERAVEKMDDLFEKTIEIARTWVVRRPATGLFSALAAGVLLGLWMKR